MAYLRSCFKRLFYSPAFYAAVLGTALICMFSPIYDPCGGEFENIFYIYTHSIKSDLLTYAELSSYSVFRSGLGGWLRMFVPVTAALASVGIKSDEYGSGAHLFFLHRRGKIKYSVESCLFYLLSGGLTVFFGFVVFGIAVYLRFPHISEFSAADAAFVFEMSFWQGSAMESLYKIGGEGLTVLAQLLEMFFYGVMQSAAPMVISVFTENKYVVICTPFFLKYTVNHLSLLFTHWAYSDPQSPNEALAQLGNIIDPEAVTAFLSYNNNSVQIILFNILLIAGASLFFCIYNQRKQNV